MKLLLLRTMTTIVEDEPEDSTTGKTESLGIFYGFTKLKDAIKKDMKTLLDECADDGCVYDDDDEERPYFTEYGYLRSFFKEELPNLFKEIDLTEFTNPKYIYPMKQIVDYDLVNDFDIIQNVRYYIVAVK